MARRTSYIVKTRGMIGCQMLWFLLWKNPKTEFAGVYEQMKKVYLFGLVLWFCLPVSAQVFRFTAIPDQNTHQLQVRFGKVADYLSKELGVKVEYVPVKSYSASVAAFKNSQVHLAWFGGLTGVQARRAVPGSQAIAQGEEDTSFVTYFIANTQTGITAGPDLPEQVKGLTFTFGSKGSTSGRLMPEFYVRQRFNTAPGKVFKRVGFSGDHSKTIALVQAGSYQVGAVNFKVYDRELAAGKIDESKVRIIWKTPSYPDYNWTIHGQADKLFGAGFSAKVKQALLAMNDPDLLASFPRTRFISANNDMYKPILDTAISIGLIDR